MRRVSDCRKKKRGKSCIMCPNAWVAAREHIAFLITYIYYVNLTSVRFIRFEHCLCHGPLKWPLTYISIYLYLYLYIYIYIYLYIHNINIYTILIYVLTLFQFQFICSSLFKVSSKEIKLLLFDSSFMVTWSN